MGLFCIGKRTPTTTVVTTAVGTTIIWIILAFRSPHLGIDVPSYLTGLSLARGAEFWVGGQIFNFEPGFRAYLVLVSKTGASAQTFLALTAALTLIPVAITVARFSKIPMLSLYLYATVGFYVFAFSGLRQAWAVALCFYALGTIKSRRPIRFLAIVGFASLIHQSALVFLPAYWIFRLKRHRLDLLFGLVGLAAVWTFRSPIYAALFALYRDGEVVEDQTGALALFLVLLLTWIVIVALQPGADDPIEDEILFTATRNYLYVAVLFQALASVSNLVGRVGQYYLIFIILLVPHVVSRQREPAARYVIVVVTVIATLLFFHRQASGTGILPHTFA